MGRGRFAVLLIITLLAALFPLPSAFANYRCRAGDLGGDAHDCRFHWHTYHQHWHFDSTLDNSPKRPSIRRSQTIWENVDSRFYFVEDAGATSHVGGRAIDPIAGTYPPAVTVPTVSGNHLIDMDIFFNTRLTEDKWNNDLNSCPNGKGYDTLGIALHERGHAIGLAHWLIHETSPLPTMHEGHFPKCWARTLTQSDMDGLRAIYDRSPEASEPLAVAPPGGPYRYFLLNAATPISLADAPNMAWTSGDYNGDGRTDVYAIKKSNTGTGSVELHVLDAASNFQNFLIQTGTPISLADAPNMAWTSGDYNGDGRTDVYAIKKSNTGTGSVEVHVLNAPVASEASCSIPALR